MGRPREFDVEMALESALKQFWRHGYEGTSLADLTEAMGITRPSLYATFGNKEDLFIKVIERYSLDHTAYVREALHQPTARAVAEYLLRSAADAQTHPGYPRGCLELQAALVCSPEAAPIRERLSRRRQAAQTALRDRLARAVGDGDLPPAAKPADLARFLSLVAQGLAVQALDGATRDDLHHAIDIALAGWPMVAA